MNTIQNTSDEDDYGIVVTADMTESDITKTSQIPITASTPDFTGNNNHIGTGKNSEIEIKDVSLAPCIEIINTSMDLTSSSPEKSTLTMQG